MHWSFGGNLSPEAGRLVGLPGMGLTVVLFILIYENLMLKFDLSAGFAR